LQGAVRRMEDRPAEVRAEVRELLAPLDGEPIVPERFVLGANLDALLRVRGEPEAARPLEGVACERLHPVDRLLGALPELAGLVRAVGLARDVVPCGRASECEAAVATARPLAHAALVVDAHALAFAREGCGARAARDAGADHRHVDLVELPRSDGRPQLAPPTRLR